MAVDYGLGNSTPTQVIEIQAEKRTSLGQEFLPPEPVVIPATYGFSNGVWFRVKQGIQGLVVRDQRGCSVVFVVCGLSTQYYQIMSGAAGMPVLVDEVI